jgi:flagellar hook protein FlgE
MGFQQGLSGLNAASKNLDAIGNNVANANAVGYKQSQAQFADVYARSLVGAADSQVGIGVNVGAVAQQFTQGNVSITNNPLDVAINGNGFYRLIDPTGAAVSYSRNGQFHTDLGGYIVNMNGLRLTGYPVNAATGLPDTNAPLQALQIPVGDQAPQQTRKANFQLNLNAEATPPKNATFSTTDTQSFNFSSSQEVYDSLGSKHVLSTYYVRNPAGAANQWTVHFGLDNVQVGTPMNLNFDNAGNLAAGTVTAQTITAGNTSLTLDLKDSTQYGGAFSETSRSQDGYGMGRLSSYTIGNDGVILGRYSNGRSAALGQVALADFKSPQGLQPVGNNLWNETAASGAASVGTPGSGLLGEVRSSSVENSNVDLSAELVNMITAQRVYQANAQTIKTQDTVLQTLVNLR